MKKPPVITIDGASGTGKGVVAHRVAKDLRWHVLDSGALYRVLALAAEKKGLNLTDEEAIAKLAYRLNIVFVSEDVAYLPRILLEGEEVTQSIRSETIGNAASKVGALHQVRTALIDRQRAFRTLPGLVTDGRDMGTVIFPDAILKIFLMASPQVRASRRFNQLKEMGIRVNLDDLERELEERDRRDRERPVAPLMPAEGAICIDTSSLTIEQVVLQIKEAAQKALS